MKCLIVDDSAPVRAMIRDVLKGEGTDFLECGDGAEATALYAAERPDWVLMDIKMKQVDGLTAARAIKQSYPGAKIIIVTNYTDRSLREEAAQAGALAYVLKDNIAEILTIMTHHGM